MDDEIHKSKTKDWNRFSSLNKEICSEYTKVKLNGWMINAKKLKNLMTKRKCKEMFDKINVITSHKRMNKPSGNKNENILFIHM